jgi:GT2 family glycosyltransferase
MKIVVGVATAGRPDLLPKVIDGLKAQARLPDAIYVCPASDKDYDATRNDGYPCPIYVVRGDRGLPAQRNAIIRGAVDADVIIFLDDDFLPDPYFTAEVERLFSDRPNLVVATGDVIADGINGPGIGYDEALSLIARLPELPAERLKAVFNAYGCNMVVRLAPAQRHGVLFDEILPLYGWWEDVDFSRRMAPYGEILKSNRLRGVHMGSKSGRTPGQKLGYSQVANIVYMMQKGSIPLGVGSVRIARNVLANAVKQFKPEPWADRRGRFIGNMKAISDCLKGNADPRKALKL